MADKEENLDEVPTVAEENTSYGDIKINHSVVASIVKLAAIGVVGVYAVGGNKLYDGITEIFSKKSGDSGVKVAEDEAGCYVIEVQVIMDFGVELAKVAYQVQEAVGEQVVKMTHKSVSRVNVIIDEVKLRDDTNAEDPEGWKAARNS